MPFRALAFQALLPSGLLHAADEKVLYDFETPADAKVWTNLELPREKEPPVKVELSTDHATAGSQSLKLTFAGGTWPTITTESVSQIHYREGLFDGFITFGVTRPSSKIASWNVYARRLVRKFTTIVREAPVAVQRPRVEPIKLGPAL